MTVEEKGSMIEVTTLTIKGPPSMNDPTGLSQENQEAKSSEYLAAYSPRDKWWDGHRSDTQSIAEIYNATEVYGKLGARMDGCTELLKFGKILNTETGELKLTLRQAYFCKARHCPVCQKRRQALWRKRFYDFLPDLSKTFPKSRWIFLTLTAKNPEIHELREYVKTMNKGWQNLVRRKKLKKLILGHIRVTEVTRAKDGKAHPHFHCMLMVPSTFFSKNYIKQSEWAEMWKECLGVDYTPIVDVRAVKKTRFDTDSFDQTYEGIVDELAQGVMETIKYATKSKDLLADKEWLLELTKQVYKLRFIETGGALKNVFKINKETDEDLALADSGGQADDGTRIAFGWERKERKYRRKKKFDI